MNLKALPGKLLRRRPPAQKLVRPAELLVSSTAEVWGSGPDWAKPVYGDYYAKSVLIYSAVRLRADSLLRAPLVVYQGMANGDKKPVGPMHPYQELLDRVNPFLTGNDLWRATSTYLDLWGSAFWVLERDSLKGVPTAIWPVRPDKMRIVGDKQVYIRGYIYESPRGRVSLLPDEVIWFRLFNPLDEFAGLSPVGLLRLSADMSLDALRHNRNKFKNGMLIDNIWIEVDASINMQEAEVDDFYRRLKARFATPDNSWRPFIAQPGMQPKNLGFSPRDMEHIQTMRWALEDVARIYQIPKIMLGDLERSTYANVDAAERIFWRNMSSYMAFLASEVNEMLSPQFGPGLFVEFDLSSIEALQSDGNAVAERQRLDVQSGVITINEARGERNLPPVPWGDTFWAPAILAPIGEGGGQVDTGRFESAQAPITSQVSKNGWRRWFPESLTEERLAAVSLAHEKRLRGAEGQFDRTQRDLFEKQRRDVLRRLSQMKTARPVFRQGSDMLFDPDDWMRAYTESGMPLMGRAVLEGAKGAIAEFGIGISFDVTRPIVQDWVSQRVAFWASMVNEETGRLLTSEIQEASALGESIPQLQSRVEKVFDFSSTIRSERIARTEMLNATNYGAVQAYEDSGVVGSKMWLATPDERTRDAHAEADRQVVPLSSDFLVGGELIPYPGAGSPGNGINCRCTTAPIISETKMMYADAKLERSGV